MGSVLYTVATSAYTASETVAVMEPAVARAVAEGQAAVTFDSIATSRVIATDVVNQAHLGITPRAMQGKVSVALARQLVSTAASPLYIVSVKDKDRRRAERLDGLVVRDSQQLFVKLNAENPADIEAAFRGEEQTLQARVAKDQDALSAFEVTQNAWDLPTQISSEIALMNTLRQARYAASAGVTTSAPQPGDAAANLKQMQAELDRLRSLTGEYSRLSFAVQLAADAVHQYATKVNDATTANQPTALHALEQQETAALAKLETARSALVSFQTANNIGDLSKDIAAQQDLVTGLLRSSLTSTENVATLTTAINREHQKTVQLAQLLSQYGALTTRLSSDGTALAQLEGRKIDAIVSQSLAPSAQVKILDIPESKGNTLLALIQVALGILVGIMAGAVVLYLLAYFDRSPHTVQDVREILGVPVLGRVPRAF